MSRHQPEIDSALQYLGTADYRGLTLDLYGSYDPEDGRFVVEDIALPGSRISLDVLATNEAINTLTRACNDGAPNFKSAVQALPLAA